MSAQAGGLELPDALNVGVNKVMDGEPYEVVAFDAVNWRDSSLGCPQSGMTYTQVITPGYQLKVVTERGETVLLHADRRGRVIKCPAANRRAPISDHPDS